MPLIPPPRRQVFGAVLFALCAVSARPSFAGSAEEANRKLAGAFYAEVFGQHNFDAACKYLSADYAQHSTDYRDPSANLKIHGCAEFATIFKGAWDGATAEQRAANHTDVLGIVAEGNRVIVYSRFAGLKKDGTRVTGTEFDMFEVENGKLTGHWSPEAATPVAG